MLTIIANSTTSQRPLRARAMCYMFIHEVDSMSRTNASNAIAMAVLVGFGLGHGQAADTVALQPEAATSTQALVGARILGIGGSPAIDDATILIRAGDKKRLGHQGAYRSRGNADAGAPGQVRHS